MNLGSGPVRPRCQKRKDVEAVNVMGHCFRDYTSVLARTTYIGEIENNEEEH